MTAPAPDTTAAPAERILLVDDTPTNLQVLFQTLHGRGYELLVARSGEEALALARDARPHLILLDIMMPGIDGFETCARLKADPELAASAVIFMSALDDTKDKVRGLAVGAVDYITKPFQAEEVIARVDTHLTIHRLRRDLERRNEELDDANRRMKQDLDAAAKVQQALLPSAAPDVASARFAWTYLPCDELAGDALNVLTLDPTHVGLFILDVSGHGVAASLLSVTITQALSRHGAGANVVTDADGAIVAPDVVADRLNRMFPMTDNAGKYSTLLYGVLDVETGGLDFVSAGHPGPVVRRASGAIDVPDASGFPLGVYDGADYETLHVDLAPGDRLFLHSDGVNEEGNGHGEQFGHERIRQVITDTGRAPLADVLARLVTALTQWHGSDSFTDDVSLLAVERTA